MFRKVLGRGRCRIGAITRRRASILVINPNTNETFTKVIRDSLLPGVDCCENGQGPESIESVYDEILSTPGTLRVVLEGSEKYDGFVIACFSDHPGVEAGREICSKPIVGLLDASCSTASFLGKRFGIVTTSKSWEPLLWSGIDRLGFKSRCGAIRSLDCRVHDAVNMQEELTHCAQKVIEKDQCDVLILGCAGFAGLVDHVSDSLGVPVIEPVAAAYHVCVSLVNQKLSTSKSSIYATPHFKRIKGFENAPVFESAYLGSESHCRPRIKTSVASTASTYEDESAHTHHFINRIHNDEGIISTADDSMVLSYEDYFSDDDDKGALGSFSSPASTPSKK